MQLMQCLASQNEVELLMQEKNLTVVKAIDGTKLLKLQKVVGEINVAKVITYFLMRFSQSFNVGKNINTTQASMIAVDIMEKYPYETIEDVLLMLKQVRQGIIGDGKDYKVDGQNVLGKDKWFEQYLENKYAEVERQNKKVSEDFSKQQQSSDHPVAVFYKKRREEKAKKEKEALVRSQIDTLVENMDRQTLEKTITEWQDKPEMKPYLDYLKRKRKAIK
ncbi:hypothetical protein [Flavobacterium sp. 102]|uniref:hypothetical protein n=1 Tax=Flavobacterium sp. 102 TaxID=2135623 RepID=UPI000F28CE28|nr:hypothetical protein [Flavobacterium sp. 102]RKS00449.1 hypothetical protein C8C84_0059 [Flavobacterium sp. 102]